MFLSFFPSKNQKLVKQWTKEHKEILELATKVSAAYKNNKFYTAKKALKEMREVTLRHLMREDNELHKLSQETEKFNDSFQDKVALIQLLKEYTNDNAVLDYKFSKSFNIMVLLLTKRFAFEEKNLYTSLSAS